MNNMSVNFNTKSIFLNEKWYTIEELSEKIKYNLNKGNFKIHELSLALEKLEETLKSAREVSFHIDSVTFSKYEHLSKIKSRPIDDFFRNALYQYVISLEGKNLNFESEKPLEISEENLIKKKKPEVLKQKPSVISDSYEDSWFKKD